MDEMERSFSSSSSTDESKSPDKSETRNQRLDEGAREKLGLTKALSVTASESRRTPTGPVASNAMTTPAAAASTQSSAASLSSSLSSSTSSLANSSATSESSAATEPAIDSLAAAVTDVISQDDFDLEDLIASLPREWTLVLFFVLFCLSRFVWLLFCSVLFVLIIAHCINCNIRCFLPLPLRGRTS